MSAARARNRRTRDGPATGGPAVSGTFVLPSPPATSPTPSTGECWLRRRDARPHVTYRGPGSHTSSDDSSPHPDLREPRSLWPCPDASQSSRCTAGSGLSRPGPSGRPSSSVPALGEQERRKRPFVPPARNLRCFRPRVLFIFIIPPFITLKRCS